MAEDEIDEEYLRLQAELNGEDEAEGKEPSKEESSGQVAMKQGLETVVVEAKPSISARSVVQPEWQQALYERDYHLMKMNREPSTKVEVPEVPPPPVVEGPSYPLPPAQQFPLEPQPIGPQLPMVVPDYGDRPTQDPLPKKRKKMIRTAAGEIWTDPTLEEWPENDHRIFVGDLAGDTTDEILTAAFQKFDGFQMARVIKDKRTRKCKGFGFVSFASAAEMVKAMKDMNGKYVGNRPVKLSKSTWDERNFTKTKRDEVRILRELKRKH